MNKHGYHDFVWMISGCHWENRSLRRPFVHIICVFALTPEVVRCRTPSLYVQTFLSPVKPARVQVHSARTARILRARTVPGLPSDSRLSRPVHPDRPRSRMQRLFRCLLHRFRAARRLGREPRLPRLHRGLRAPEAQRRRRGRTTAAGAPNGGRIQRHVRDLFHFRTERRARIPHCHQAIKYHTRIDRVQVLAPVANATQTTET
jgi:hypothetical protein